MIIDRMLVNMIVLLISVAIGHAISHVVSPFIAYAMAALVFLMYCGIRNAIKRKDMNDDPSELRTRIDSKWL